MQWSQHRWNEGVDGQVLQPHDQRERAGVLDRQYFPKGTDLSVHSAADLDWIAAELNDRPRKRFGFAKPDELIGHLLQQRAS